VASKCWAVWGRSLSLSVQAWLELQVSNCTRARDSGREAGSACLVASRRPQRREEPGCHAGTRIPVPVAGTNPTGTGGSGKKPGVSPAVSPVCSDSKHPTVPRRSSGDAWSWQLRTTRSQPGGHGDRGKWPQRGRGGQCRAILVNTAAGRRRCPYGTRPAHRLGKCPAGSVVRETTFLFQIT
jgi:hypothetical protein